MPIYDPITKQRVTLLGRYPVQTYCFKFGKEQKGEFRFATARYEEESKGGFKAGEVRDVDINFLVADDGSKEIHAAYEALPEIPSEKSS